MSKKYTEILKKNSGHNYLNTQKSNAHTKINGNLVQLWFGNSNLPIFNYLEPTTLTDVIKSKVNPNQIGSITSKLVLASFLAATGFILPAHADLTITDASGGTAAADLADAILGEGVTINSSTYYGGTAQSGTFVTGPGTTFGSDVLSFTDGAIFSTGTAASVGGGNSGTTSVNAAGVDGDADFNALTSPVSSLDATWIDVTFTPDVFPGTSVGDTGRMTIQVVFSSEEYNEYVYGGFNDSMAVIVNGVNKSVVPNGLSFGIDTINTAGTVSPTYGSVANDPNPEHTAATFESANPSLFKNNTALNAEMDGLTVTIPVTFDIIIGQVNTLKIGIADAADASYDSWLFVKGNSGQTVIVAENDSVTAPSNVPINVDVTANDFDLQGDVLTITHLLGEPVSLGDTVTLASGSTVKLELDGTLTISGDGTNASSDAFSYEITDGNGGSSMAIVNTAIIAVDPTPPSITTTSPIEGDDIISMAEADSVSISGTTINIEDNQVVTVIISDDSNSVTTTGVVTGGVWTATDVDVSSLAGGSLTVRAEVSDLAGITVSDSDAVTHINNSAPVGTADTASTNEDTSVNITVVGNDNDADGDAITPTNLSTPANGSAVLNADGVTIDYTPNANFNGSDTFTYTPNDGSADGAAVTVTVNVTAENDLPVAAADTATTAEDTLVNIAVVGNDNDAEGDAITPTNLTSPANGSAVLNADGVTIDYTPNANFNGSDTFTYTPNDGTADGAAVTVTVNVTAENDVPVGVADGATTAEDTLVNISVVGNDNDAEGDAITPTNLSIPANGSAVLNADGVTIDYTPNANFNGSDTFTYTPNDGTADGAAVTVTVNVTAENDVPVGVADGATTAEDTLVNISVVGNDNDAEGDAITPTNLSSPANGSAVLNADGVTIDYTPNANFNGSDTFTYTPNDGSADGAAVTVTVMVLADTDADGIIDSIDLDDDNDGIPDLLEQAGDTDNDGIVDSLDLDSDNDGILDIVEAGGIDSDNNGLVDDPTDTDHDGLADIADANSSSVDAPKNFAEALLIATLPIIDTDVDGTRDFQDVDSDNDGISDLVEGGTDPALDSDRDGDIDTVPVDPATGIATGITPSLAPNTDGDGVPDYRDLDSDNDGINDVIEAGGVDTDGNGLIDTPNILVVATNIPDANNDGVSDPLEPNNPNLPAALDENGDGVIDDNTDTDGDGIPDVFDGGDTFNSNVPLKDTDNDDIPDIYDIDDDNDGIPDLVEQAGDPAKDTDNDGIIDSLDLDSDNDGILDILEAGGIDTDGDGVVDDATDTDNDGLADVVDANPAISDSPENATEAALATSLPVIDTDGDDTPNFQDVDSDNDGMSDLVEGGLESAVVDINNDGMVDTTPDINADGVVEGVGSTGIATVANPATMVNPIEDTDSDGVPDYRDLDSDNDGLHDVVESGGSDEDEDGAIDTDTLTDSAVIPDTDNDGTPDPLEPSNPNLPPSIDADGDGVIDDATDTDGDGVPDVTDIAPTSFGVLLDTDRDGIPNEIDLDLDDDNDGVPDLVEQQTAQNGGDSDGDGVPDELDMDSDGDGLSDLSESGLTAIQILDLDSNNDGVIDAPVGLNGLANQIETDDTQSAGQDFDGNGNVDTPADTDGDGRPDFQDLDSDNDGIHDLNEGGDFDAAVVDTNNDGVIDDITEDADGDGIPDSIDSNDSLSGGITNTPADTDHDGIPDYQEIDSDGDGIYDLIEGATVDAAIVDTNNDGILDNADIDSDNDGIPDSGDGNVTSYGDTQGQSPVDTDGDTIPDYNDLDSDNDSLSDVSEAGHEDLNEDGLFDEAGTRASDIKDTDNDGIPDFRELDSDDDGVMDIAGTAFASLDANKDGKVDSLSDLDNDGVMDDVDTTPEQYGVRPSDDNLETAVSGFGGSTGPWSLFTMMMLLGFKRLRSTKLIQRLLPMLLVAVFIVPGLLAPTTAQAETKTFAKSTSKCGTQSAFNACNYVAGGLVISHVDPEGNAGGWSTSDNISAGYNIIVGRHFKPHWFGELSYTDMGEAELSNSAASISDKESISYKVPSLHIGYLLRDPSKAFNVYAKGGVSAIQNDVSAARVPFEKQTSIQATFGLGAQWQAKDSGLFARLGADFHDRDAVSAGLMIGYKFGKTQQKVAVKKVVKPAPVIVRKAMAKPVAKKVVIRKPAQKPTKRVVKQPSFSGVLKGVNFHTNSSVLTPKAELIQKDVAQQLKRWSDLKVLVIGHTDNVGSSTSNMSLSQRRANSVKDYLVKHGVKTYRIGTAGKGENLPRATNDTSDGRAANRRVELRAFQK